MNHAHIARTGRDCDGEHGQYGIEVQPDDERYYNWKSGLESMLVGIAASNEAGHVQIRVVPLTDDTETPLATGETWDSGTDTPVTMTASTPTEEGYSALEIRTCADDCDLGERSQYDQYAELMGY